MKKISSNLINIVLVLVFLVGLSLLLYPSVSNYWNSFHQTKAIAGYADEVAALDKADYEKMWEEAKDYNSRLALLASPWAKTEKDLEEYNSLLNLAGSGIMGYIEIPDLKVSLPIYHGVDEAVLQVAVGHLDWTSLPAGGEGTHCVLSGHRGLPSAKLFTNLDKMREGDLFMLRILDEVLTYEVDQILIVEPQETGALRIEKGKDYCTLVTCTPYGINSHRLLVRGHRVENLAEAKNIRVTSDAIQIEPLMVAPIVAAPILLVLILMLMLPKKKKRNHGGDTDEDI